MRKNAFNKLYNSCKRKRNRRIQEEKEEMRRKAEEKKRLEEEKRAERKRRAEEMEKEAEEMLKEEFDCSWKELGIDISEDEEEDAFTNPEKGEEENNFVENGNENKSVDNVKDIKSDIDNESEVKTQDDDVDDDDNNSFQQNSAYPTQSFGANAEEESASSTVSCSASGQTPTRKSMRLQTKNISLKLSERSQFSTATVQILSNPSLITALEVFQGSKFGSQDDIELLRNPRVLQAVREFHSSIGTEVSGSPEEQFDENVIQHMKKEGVPSKRGAKRKLTDYESFAGVLKTTPKRKKSSKENDVSVEKCMAPLIEA